MNGGAMMAWFLITSAAALVAWTRAELVRARRPWIPPALVLVLSFVFLLVVA